MRRARLLAHARPTRQRAFRGTSLWLYPVARVMLEAHGPASGGLNAWPESQGRSEADTQPRGDES